jgi:hypothetical protein
LLLRNLDDLSLFLVVVAVVPKKETPSVGGLDTGTQID